MEDDHTAAVEFETEYSVQFIVGSTEDLSADVAQPPQVAAQETTQEQQQAQQGINHYENINVNQPSLEEQHEENYVHLKCIRNVNIRRETNGNENGNEYAEINPREPDTNKDTVVDSKQYETCNGRVSITVVLSKEEIMEMYNEREKLFNEDVLSATLPPQTNKVKKNAMRSLSSSPSQPCAGMDHLGNLVRLMEQMSVLREQNVNLKRKCAYLEDTKCLLRVQNRMLLTKDHGKGSRIHHKSFSKSQSDSSDMDNSIKEPRNKPLKLQHRSQSVGSISVDDLVGIELELVGGEKGQHVSAIKSPEKCPKDINKFEAIFSKSKITSKWERVKKVFSGKPEHTTTKTETISAEQLVRANSKHIHISHPMHPSLLQSKSHDGVTGMNSSSLNNSSIDSPEIRDDRNMLKPNMVTDMEGPPPSPNSTQSEPIAIPSVVMDDNDIYEDVMPPPHDMSLENDAPSSSLASSIISEDGSSEIKPSQRDSNKSPAIEEKIPPQKSNYLTVQNQLKRRKSSPTLTLSEERELDNLDLQPPQRSPRLGRSASFKASKSNINSTLSEETCSKTLPKSTESRKARSAWGRVKEIIHTRKDSLKLKNKRSNSAGDALPDGSVSDGEVFQYDEEYWERDSPPQTSSPQLIRKESGKQDSSPVSTSPPDHKKWKAKSPSRSPTLTRRDTYHGHVSTLSSSPVDVSALLGKNYTSIKYY